MSRFIFDENGEMLIIDNIDNYLTIQFEEDIVKVLTTNMYWNSMNILLDEMVSLGHMERIGDPYNKSDIELTIYEIKAFLIDNFDYGLEHFKKIENNVSKILPKK